MNTDHDVFRSLLLRESTFIYDPVVYWVDLNPQDEWEILKIQGGKECLVCLCFDKYEAAFSALALNTRIGVSPSSGEGLMEHAYFVLKEKQ